jgi:transcriptional regulator GlxA family with amidase domain
VQSIGFVVFPGFQVMSFAAVTAFEMADLELSEPAYRVALLSEDGGLVQSSAGFRVEIGAFGNVQFDTAIIGAGTRIEPATPALTCFVRRSMETARRVAAPCTGAFVLTEAGVLDGRRATTHWFFAKDLQRRHPTVKVEEDRIYITDGPIWT